jgi:3-oxoacyl-[acyl-carrier protein] reductase
MENGYHAIVTGGSRGIGRAIALELAKKGVHVTILYAGNTAAAQQTVDDAAQLGAALSAVRCDVSNFEETKAVVSAFLSETGQVDILVNCAGITRDGLMLRMSEQDFDAVIGTNLKGTFNMIRHCCGPMMRRQSGRIINISSVAGLAGNPGQANYSAAKAGVIGLTKTVAREFAGRGIACNAVAPGFIETDMTGGLSEKVREAALAAIPMKRMGTPEEIASIVTYLAVDAPVYLTGEVFRVDGGLYL